MDSYIHNGGAPFQNNRGFQRGIMVETHFSELPDLQKIKTYTNLT